MLGHFWMLYCQIGLYRQATDLINSTASQHHILALPLNDFSQEIKQSSDENDKILLESISHCEHLGSSLKIMCQETSEWGETANVKTVCIADRQKAALSSRKEHLQRLCKVTFRAIRCMFSRKLVSLGSVRLTPDSFSLFQWLPVVLRSGEEDGNHTFLHLPNWQPHHVYI